MSERETTAGAHSLFSSQDTAASSVQSAQGLAQRVQAAMFGAAERPAIEFQGRWYTWGELRQVFDGLVAALASSGCQSGAAIAFIPRNRPSAAAALLGLLGRGSFVRMIYAFQSSSAIARDVERVRPAAVVAAEEDFTPELRAVLESRGVAAVALGEMEARCLPGLQTANPDADVSPVPRIELLTSGTTGPPKRFGIGYELVSQLLGPEQDLSSATPVLLYFPLGNISGIFSTVPTLVNLQRVVLLDRFTVPEWHDYICRYKPNFGSLPPSAVRAVLDAEVPPEDLACLRYVASGAAPLDPRVQRDFEARYGAVVLLSYGATEFGGPVTAMTAELHGEFGQRKFGSVGRALPGVQLRVIDPGTGEEVNAGTPGVLEVISPRVGPDWIRTSDLVVIDEDGFLFHRGRSDGAIMRGGFKVLPETIEHALLEHPALAAVAVVAVPNDRLGEVPGVALELRPGFAPPPWPELEQHLRQRLPATHVPVHHRFVTALPRTASLKVERASVRELFTNQE